MGSRKHKNLKMNKNDYLKYRNALIVQKVFSYYDQYGRLFTSCSDCKKMSCEVRNDVGCMIGEISAELEKRIDYET